GYGGGDIIPLMLFSLLLGFGCFYLGRARGRQDIRTNPQVFGVPTPPPELKNENIVWQQRKSVRKLELNLRVF
ncbi:hypothetical protein CICLE_v10017780mg, partial [Citrus x clementina]